MGVRALLQAKSHPAVGAYNAPRRPSRFGQAEHPHHPGNLLAVRRPTPSILRHFIDLLLVHALSWRGERRRLDERLVLRNKRLVVAPVHVRRNGPRVDGVYGAALCELTRPCPCHALQCSFGAAVDGLALVSERRADRRETDDATRAVMWQVGNRRLQQQQRSTHIDVELPRKVFAINLLHNVVPRYARVVDDDCRGTVSLHPLALRVPSLPTVELEFARFRMLEVVLGRLHEMLRPVL